ncbi:hypothetical protein [Aliarcobacter butzleri]|uniref:hypothetical protein n=1 Tax=Aliarcobacter butzleri TaxID=28197 RepID=UPI00126A3EF6|nr:hypothetical protein [Aliarcobacter butzleri]
MKTEVNSENNVENCEQNNRIETITFDYNSHDNIQTKITYKINGQTKNIISDTIMKIEEDGVNKYFDNEKIKDADSGIFNSLKSVYYYDRSTVSLETNENRKKKLAEIFKDSKNVKNVLFIVTGEQIDVIPNVDTKKISFKITDKAQIKKNNFDEFENKFYSSNIKIEEINVLNSIRFSYAAYPIAKDLIDKISKQVAIKVIKNTPDIFDTNLTMDDAIKLSYSLNNYFINKHFGTDLFMSLGTTSLYDNYFDENNQEDLTINDSIKLIKELADVKNIRNITNFKRLLEGELASSVASSNVPLKNEVDRILSIRQDTLLMNQTNSENIETLSEHFKDNKFGFVCIQDSKNELVNRNAYKVEVDKSNLNLSIKASMSKACDALNKVLDLREIDNLEHREKIFKAINPNSKNFTILTKNLEDISFLSYAMKNGNIYKIDSRYLGSSNNENVYIADIAEFGYFNNDTILNLLKVNEEKLNKRIISLPEFKSNDSLIKNHFELELSMVNKVVKQKENLLLGNEDKKVDALYKFNELIRDNIKEFDIFDINKEYMIIKKSEEFYKYAKDNIGLFFTSNLPTIFSSFSVNKEKKVFNNGFYYNLSSAISIKDIEQTPPLLTYISKTPNGEIISKIAKKFNVDINVEKPFSLTNLERNKLNIGKKDIVTTAKRGAIDFAYTPKTFILETNEEKAELKDIIKTIFQRDNTISEDKIAAELIELNNLVDKSSYLMMKNEQTIIDTSKFAPKEILVFLDENTNDLAKLNIPISDFYTELKDRKIYDINDYIEIAKPNSLFIEKLSNGLLSMISEFRKEHEESIGITKEQIDEVLNKKSIKLSDDRYISPSEILLSKGNAAYKDKLFRDIGNSLSTLNFYKKYIELEDSNKIFTWLNKTALPKESKENITKVLKEKFIGNEIIFIEKYSSALFTYIQKNIPEENSDLYTQIENKIFDIYHNKKQENNIVSKTARLYSLENSIRTALKSLNSIDLSMPKKDVYQAKLKYITQLKSLIDIFALDISGLRPHQYEESLNYAVLNNLGLKDTQMAFLEMRAGKTGIAIFTQLFLALTGNAKDDLTHNFFVQSSNMNDIANQVMNFCPIMAKDITFVSSDKISSFKKEKSVELPVSIAKQITPHIIQMVKPIIKFKGEKTSLKSDTVTLANTYTTDMNQIYNQLQYYTQDELFDVYANSPFIDVLKLTSKKKVDKDIANAIKQSFVYLQMIYEKKYISANDKDFVLEKMSDFVQTYIESKEAFKKNNVSKKGIVLIPKNSLYSINVDSPITGKDIKKKDSERKISHSKLQTPYELETTLSKETLLSGFTIAEKQKDIVMDIIKESLTMPAELKNLSKQGIIFKVSKTQNDSEILKEKENIANSFLSYEKINEISEDLMTIMESYVANNMKDTSLVSSPLYRIEGLDEQFPDTLKINLSDLFSQEKLEEFLKDYSHISDEDKEKVISRIGDAENHYEFAKKSNELYFDNAIYPFYNTVLAGNFGKRVEIISPLLAKKYKDLLYSFKMDFELIDEKLPLPIRKEKIDTKFNYYLDLIKLEHKAMNLADLTNPVNKDVKGLQFEVGYSQSTPLFRVKREQNPDLLLETIVKRNEALNNKYIVDISPNKTIMSFDEAHKGLKTKSSSLTIHDVISYLHKVALDNKGSVSIMSGTPTSGLAEETGKIMSTGLDTAQSALITKSIDAYCTTYEFKDNMDAIIISTLDAFPGGKVEQALEKILIIKEKDTNKDNYKLTKQEIEGLKNEFEQIIRNIPTLDAVQKDELLSNKLNNKYLENKFNGYKELFKIEEQLDKIEFNPKYKIKITDLRQLLLSKIHLLTKKVPGINNYSTLASILLQMGSKNSINITRASENRVYNIIDDEILKKQYDARDVKESVSINIDSFKDKTLAMSAYFESYRRVLKLTEVKETISQIFEAWTIDMFSAANKEKTINMFGLSAKFPIEDINSIISRSGKTVKDSVSDIFNILYFGSEAEKEELSNNQNLQEKLGLVLDIIDKFNEFTDKYYSFQNEARVLYENELEKAKLEDREPKSVYLMKDGFRHDASKYHLLSSDLGNINLFERLPSATTENVITLSNIGDVLLNDKPIVFKTFVKANNWNEFSKKGIGFKYSLTNPLETEIMEYLSSDSSTLYKEHIDKGENIRVMSGRSAALAISFMDTLKALIHRENKDKKAVLILNKNSSKDFNFSKIINSLDLSVLENANIDIKVTKSTMFQNVLDDVSKNKNNQICVVGNYGALAEGFNMVCINAAFYVSSTPNGQLAIQSFARDTNAEKELSNIYLCNNGLINKYTISNKINPKYFTDVESDAYDITRAIYSNNIKLSNVETPVEYRALKSFDYDKITPTIVMTANASKTKVEAYTAVMTGNYPRESIDYNLKSIISLSDYSLNKNNKNDEENIIKEDMVISEDISTEISNNK